MNNKIVNFPMLLMIVAFAFVAQSCSSDQKEAIRRVEYTQIVERKSSMDVMNELYIASDGDVEALARILQTTPSVIHRIRTGETYPTMDFEEKCKEVLVYYNVNGRSFSKLRSALDDEYGWYDSVLNFRSHPPRLSLVAWICRLIGSPDPMVDKYVDTIDPVVEQIK